jgi:hypothetical protein
VFQFLRLTGHRGAGDHQHGVLAATHRLAAAELLRGGSISRARGADRRLLTPGTLFRHGPAARPGIAAAAVLILIGTWSSSSLPSSATTAR